MVYTVLGMFDTVSKVEHLVLDAEAAGFPQERISCMLRFPKTLSQNYALYATIDILLDLYKLTIPSIGTVFIGGPLTASFGLIGATNETITKAATGLVAGGMVGACIGLGMSKSSALSFEKKICGGKILVGIPATEDEIPFIQELFSQHHGKDTVVIKTPTHQYPYLLSSIATNQSSIKHYTSLYMGAKGGKKYMSSHAKKQKNT